MTWRRKAVGGKGVLNELITELFEEQPLASPGSAIEGKSLLVKFAAPCDSGASVLSVAH